MFILFELLCSNQWNVGVSIVFFIKFCHYYTDFHYSLFMNFSAQSGVSFLLDTKTASVGINTKGKDISLFSSFQSDEFAASNINWPGEYETKGVSVFVSPVYGTHSALKIFAEGIRISYFSDDGFTGNAEELVEFFGNTDVLIVAKSENGIADAEYKKIIEKIDPRVILCAGEISEKMLKGFSFPLQMVAKISITPEKLPAEISEYYCLSF